MGERHELRCEKCGYGINAMLGIGMLYSKEMVFDGETPSLGELVQDESITDTVLAKIATGSKVADDYGHYLYSCPDDFYLFNKFYFKVDGIEVAYPCPYGDATLKRLIFAKGKAGTTRLQFLDGSGFWHCPKCGNESLNEVSFGNWD